MIVLGQHVLAHHLLAVEGDCDGDEGDQESFDCKTSRGSAHNAGSVDEETGDHFRADSPSSVPRGETMQLIGEDSMQLWGDARLKASMALGSIGAPPLASSVGDRPSTSIACGDAASPNAVLVGARSAFRANLDCLSYVANSHAELLQTMNRTIDALSAGTSIRLGLGPINSAGDGNGRLVARAEKAWAARRLKQQPSREFKSDDARCHPPRLTLHRSRNVLHRAIVDQAMALWGMLKNCSASGSSTTTDWNDFAVDLQHSLQESRVLTLSLLSIWVNRLGVFLSCVLSEYLSQSNLLALSVSDGRPNSIVAGVKHSLQVARELTVFLHSACPLSRPPRDKNYNLADAMEVEDIDWNDRGNHGGQPINLNHNEADNKMIHDYVPQTKCQKKRQVKREMENLKDTLEAARVTLWAFEHSYSDLDNDTDACADDCSIERDNAATAEDNTAKVWWDMFKDLIIRSHASIPEFEQRFLLTDDGKGDEGGTTVNGSTRDLPNADSSTIEFSEHVSNAIGINDGNLVSDDDGVDSKDPLADKTLVFSGSGAKKPHPPHKRNTPVPSEQESLLPSFSFNAADQMMLLRDLEKRIKTMGIAEEHEVVTMCSGANGDCDETLERETTKGTSSSSSGYRKQEGKSQPFFLGASGTLLAELTSTMARSKPCDSISGGDGVT